MQMHIDWCFMFMLSSSKGKISIYTQLTSIRRSRRQNESYNGVDPINFALHVKRRFFLNVILSRAILITEPSRKILIHKALAFRRLRLRLACESVQSRHSFYSSLFQNTCIIADEEFTQTLGL